MLDRFAPASRAARWTAIAVVITVVAPCRAAVTQEPQPDTLPSTVALLRDVMVPMRDGVRLATDIYLPAHSHIPLPGRYPTILQRTPYNKERWTELGPYFASRGYAVVQQDTRGRFKSEGRWRMLADDGRDGADACNWIARQQWSDGHMGMIGGSYEGGTQHALALAHCSHLTTLVPLYAVANPGYAGLRYAGAFELRFFNWIFLYGAPEGSHAARDPAKRPILEQMRDQRLSYLSQLPLRAGQTPLRLAPEYEQWLIEAMHHGGHDSFWRWNDVVDDAARYQDLPICFLSGWYDSWAGGTTADYAALAAVKRGPVYLIMGPWTHGGQGEPGHGQVSFGPASVIPDFLDWHREWFDHWLKAVSNPVGTSGAFASPVRIFVMGTGDGHKDAEGRLMHGGSWREEHEWPLARTRYTNYYLRADSSLSTTAPIEAPGQAGASRTYVFDPRDPVPTIGGNLSSSPGMMENGGFDQRGNPKIWNWPNPIPLASRKDVIVFQSAPLERDLEVTGEITVILWASSDARDTDFTAKLIDAYPPTADWPEGFALNLEDGIVRARFRGAFPKPFRDGGATEKLMAPGTPYQFTIRLYPTSNVFKRGHRIRLDISSSNYPRFDVNPNTGEPLGANTHTRAAHNTILLDRTHPSHVILPIIP